jgi:UDP-3-O-acyl-N-acetylglucosamine deacetylase
MSIMGDKGYHGVNIENFLIIPSRHHDRLCMGPFGPRFEEQNEFVRHKVQDVLGTLALTGRHFKDTEFRFEMTGHKFDIYALKELFNKGCFFDSH